MCIYMYRVSMDIETGGSGLINSNSTGDGSACFGKHKWSVTQGSVSALSESTDNTQNRPLCHHHGIHSISAWLSFWK